MLEYDVEYVEKVKDLADRLNYYIPADKIEKLISCYVWADEDSAREEIKETIDTLVSSHLPKLVFTDKPLYKYPPKEKFSDDSVCVLGKVIDGGMPLFNYGLSLQEFSLGPLMIAGRTGHGKTTVLMSLVSQLLKNEIPFLVMDFKLDFRNLIKQHPQLLVLSWKDLRVNLLRPPPGVTFDEWKQLFLNIFGSSEGAWSASTQFLLRFLDQVRQEKGDRASIIDLYKKMCDAPPNFRRMQDYWSVIETRLSGLISKLKTVVACEEGIDIEELLKHGVVLELDGMSYEDQTLLVLFFFYWIYSYRKAHRHRGKALHFLIIDEAKRVWPASDEFNATTREFSHIPPADLIVNEMRDFSEVLVAADNAIFLLSRSLLAQAYAKVIGCVSGEDLNIVTDKLNLDDEWREIVSGLDRGEWVVKLSSNYTKPFLIKSDDFPITKDVTDEQVRQHMKPILSRLMPKKPVQTSGQRVVLPKVSEDAFKLLVDVNAHPFRGLTTRCRGLGFSWRRMEATKAELIQKGLVKKKEVTFGSNRPAIFLTPTKLGLLLLKNSKQSTGLWERLANSSFEHRLYAILVAYGFKNNGYRAFIEKTLDNDKRLDVLVLLNNRRIGIEIELDTTVDIEDKLEYLNEVDKLIILAKDTRVLRAIERKLIEVESVNVSLHLLRDFLNELRSKVIPHGIGEKPVCRNSFDSHFNYRSKRGAKGSLEIE